MRNICNTRRINIIVVNNLTFVPFKQYFSLGVIADTCIIKTVVIQ